MNPISQLLIISPTTPPIWKKPDSPENKKLRQVDAITNPNVTYLRLRKMENIFLEKRRLMATTKKKVQNKNEANPKP
jgi:hypothetical protein